ncbi:hypothetical protein GCM10029992_53220 [Glycomyces albus]
MTVHERTSVERIGAELAITDTGRVLPSAATVWSVGFAQHPIAAAAGLATEGVGRIEVDRTMRSVSHPSVWAVGDAAMAPGPKEGRCCPGALRPCPPRGRPRTRSPRT